MKTKEKLYDKELYLRKLRKATRELSKLEKLMGVCSTDELEATLRQYRAARLKVEQLEDRLKPPKAVYEIEVIPLNAHTYEE